MKLEIEITEFDDLPDGDRFIAVLKSEKYPEICEGSNCISGCIAKIANSIYVLEEYRKRKKE